MGSKTQLELAKFGGTSVADYDAMLKSAQIVKNSPESRVVVLSASAGVTNLLIALAEVREKKLDHSISQRLKIFKLKSCQNWHSPNK